ncbi:hypothetical protein AVEN_44782-1, partial [Araneus ventricosus]
METSAASTSKVLQMRKSATLAPVTRSTKVLHVNQENNPARFGYQRFGTKKSLDSAPRGYSLQQQPAASFD